MHTKYREYPILCQTCGELIACFSSTYEKYVLECGMTQEEALNALGIMFPCSRIAMMNPVVVKFDTQHNGVIEGTVTPAQATMETKDFISTDQPVFNLCRSLKTPAELENNYVRYDPGNDENDGYDSRELMSSSSSEDDGDIDEYKKNDTQDRNEDAYDPKEHDSKNRPLGNDEVKVSKKSIVNAPLPGSPGGAGIVRLDEITADPNEVGIPLNNVNIQHKNLPTVVGFPTILYNPLVKEQLEYIGGGNRYVTVLSGRTFLAQ